MRRQRPQGGHVIRLTVDLTAAAEAAERAMHGAGLPLYRRGAMLVRPLMLDAHTFGGGRAKTIGLIAVPTILLRSYMGQAAAFEKFDGRGKDWVSCKPPIDVAELILGRAGHWPFEEIRGVLAAPSMRPDGSILRQPGFDPATGMYLIDPPAMPDIPDKPTQQDACQALAVLDSLLDSFPGRATTTPRGRLVDAGFADHARLPADGADALRVGAYAWHRQELPVRPGGCARDRLPVRCHGGRQGRGGTREAAELGGARRYAGGRNRQRQPAARR